MWLFDDHEIQSLFEQYMADQDEHDYMLSQDLFDS